MTWSQQKLQNDHILNFWEWLTGLPDRKYLRAQKLCNRLVGGYVKGIEKDEDTFILIVE